MKLHLLKLFPFICLSCSPVETISKHEFAELIRSHTALYCAKFGSVQYCGSDSKRRKIVCFDDGKNRYFYKIDSQKCVEFPQEFSFTRDSGQWKDIRYLVPSIADADCLKMFGLHLHIQRGQPTQKAQLLSPEMNK